MINDVPLWGWNKTLSPYCFLPKFKLSNGFKVKSADNTVNASGGIYIYGAWAAQPQQTSSGIPATAR